MGLGGDRVLIKLEALRSTLSKPIRGSCALMGASSLCSEALEQQRRRRRDPRQVDTPLCTTRIGPVPTAQPPTSQTRPTGPSKGTLIVPRSSPSPPPSSLTFTLAGAFTDDLLGTLPFGVASSTWPLAMAHAHPHPRRSPCGLCDWRSQHEPAQTAGAAPFQPFPPPTPPPPPGPSEPPGMHRALPSAPHAAEPPGSGTTLGC
jgi:hypothetical protein